LASGDVEGLHLDYEKYVMKRLANAENPRLILYISTGSTTKRRNVQTNWNNVTLLDYSGNTTYTPTSDENGMVTIEAPANGYSIFSITK
jgi:alpha-amylase